MTKTLWRPVGKNELNDIETSEMTAFPSRLATQPIFYPLLDHSYAIRVARDWNAKYDGFGYVTEFDIEEEFLKKYNLKKITGTEGFEVYEYEIPAGDMKSLNENIVGVIRVVDSFHNNDVRSI